MRLSYIDSWLEWHIPGVGSVVNFTGTRPSSSLDKKMITKFSIPFDSFVASGTLTVGGYPVYGYALILELFATMSYFHSFSPDRASWESRRPSINSCGLFFKNLSIDPILESKSVHY